MQKKLKVLESQNSAECHDSTQNQLIALELKKEEHG
jgi:hypothetical protein